MKKNIKYKSKFEWNKILEEYNQKPKNEKPNFQPYTLEEVSKHNSLPSIWTIYEGKVYDITMYLEYHPGGIDILKSVYGKDCTVLYNKFHSYINIDNFLKPFLIGYISKK